MLTKGEALLPRLAQPDLVIAESAGSPLVIRRIVSLRQHYSSADLCLRSILI